LDATSKTLHLHGAGMGKTVIQVTGGDALDIIGSRFWTVSDFTFTGGVQYSPFVAIGGDSPAFRFHHVEFTNAAPLWAIIVQGPTVGVIDHCQMAGGDQFANIEAGDVSSAAWAPWRKPITLGDGNAVYVEDTTVSGVTIVDGARGAQIVVRHNNVTDSWAGYVHGFDSGSSSSALRLEVYANQVFYTSALATVPNLGTARGGTGVWFDNTWTSAPNVFLNPIIDLALYRTVNDSPSWPACDGTQYRMCSSIDKDWNGEATACTTDANCPAGATCKWRFCSASKTNLCAADADCPAGETCSGYLDGSGPNGYPCMNQPGFGPNMKSMPIYSWNNKVVGGQNNPSGVALLDPQVGSGGQLQENRDYFNGTPMPGYTPYTYPHPLTACP
jgi:Cys-rich repeat protein